MLSSRLLQIFRRSLLKWHFSENTRTMPWKGENDPYKVWLSEIILQQTRVEQGTDYYLRFIKRFPDIHQLAAASDNEVYKLWEGLGYYSRCRNLLHTARQISAEGGKFPDNYNELIKLKGVGPYTAAAIASFAFGKPYAVVDGNVFRVLSRITGNDLPIDTKEGKKLFTSMAEAALSFEQPAAFNQAIMDFGATICKPLSPLCSECFFRRNCKAYAEGRVADLPVKSKKLEIRSRYFNYLILEHGKFYAVQQRKSRDIWHNLFEYPLIETVEEAGKEAVIEEAVRQGLLGSDFEVAEVSTLYKQKLTHQIINAKFYRIRIKKPVKSGNLIWLPEKQLAGYAFPGIINRFHEQARAVENRSVMKKN